MNKKHGMTKHPLYDVWWNMRDRVLNPNHQFYHRYGGRGITICKEWSSDVVTFYNWAIVNGWEKGLQIDRRDNDGNYCPENCRFVLHTKNGQNRSTTIMDWKTINALRAEFEPGMNISLLGKKYGTKNISEILNNKIWYNKDYIVPDFLKNKEWIKMGNEKVNALRAEYEPGITQAFLAKKYNIDPAYVSGILLNKICYNPAYIPLSSNRKLPVRLSSYEKTNLCTQHKNNKSRLFLAKKYNISRGYVDRILREEGIK